jgi:NAD dependent epimerase/dehydratase family enzyme
VAPFPVSNKEFTLQLAKILSNKFFLPVHIPTFALKMVLGEMSIEVLKSTTVSSAKVQAEGYNFLYPTSEEALKQIFKK